MIQKDATYVVMGLLDPNSIAFAVGQVVEQWGGKVIYYQVHRIGYRSDTNIPNNRPHSS